ncbi:MAG: thioesterase [Alphaproteobacteria bacterium]|nr:thioesterase [Alphaproteobacteria bacterium]
MTGAIETYRGMVYPWQCDHQGHMTTQHYVGMFDQAGWHLLNALDLNPEVLAADGRGFVDVKHTIEYLAEQRVGSLVFVESGLRRVGASSITVMNWLRNARDGVLSATCELVTVHFDLDARVKLPIPEDVRARLAARIVEGA